ncbi:MAG: hypothetical protein A2464_07710 [Deltaproteobacteria bacterium RIFOXYC2_FULL_48_10]|nr:MAG: hypothetical protein A2464_07710 [Deltaproteobacteria bacterium RIFOXYC2_FULL_48_10]
MKQIGVLIIGGLMMFSCAGQRPENSGVQNGRLPDCPTSPNCVSSQAADDRHGLPPLQYQDEKKAAFKRLKKIITSIKGNTIVSETNDYLHIECKSKIMGFVDDLEFFFPDERIIHVRSASRLGYSDFGVNRKRVEHLRELFISESTDTRK